MLNKKNSFYILIVILVIFFGAGLKLLPPHRDFVDFFSSVAPVLLTVILIYIAYQQLKNDELKVKTCFFEQRIAALDELERIIKRIDKIPVTDFGVHGLEKENIKSVFNELYSLNNRFKILFGIEDVLTIRNLLEAVNRNAANQENIFIPEDASNECKEILTKEKNKYGQALFDSKMEIFNQFYQIEDKVIDIMKVTEKDSPVLNIKLPEKSRQLNEEDDTKAD